MRSILLLELPAQRRPGLSPAPATLFPDNAFGADSGADLGRAPGALAPRAAPDNVPDNVTVTVGCETCGTPRPLRPTETWRAWHADTLDVPPAVLRNTLTLTVSDRNASIDNSEDAPIDDVVGERATLMLAEREDGELRAELCLWPAGSNPDQDPPRTAHWGPLAKLADTLRRHGVSAAGLVRAMVQAGCPMTAVERAARAMA